MSEAQEQEVPRPEISPRLFSALINLGVAHPDLLTNGFALEDKLVAATPPEHVEPVVGGKVWARELYRQQGTPPFRLHTIKTMGRVYCYLENGERFLKKPNTDGTHSGDRWVAFTSEAMFNYHMQDAEARVALRDVANNSHQIPTQKKLILLAIIEAMMGKGFIKEHNRWVR